MVKEMMDNSVLSVKNIDLKLAQQSDAASVVGLWGGVYHEKNGIEYPPPAIEIVEEVIRKNLMEGMPYYLARYQGQLIGSCEVIRSKNSRQNLGIMVHKEYRGIGLGGQLLSASIENLKRSGSEFLYIKVLKSNLPAIALYKKFGAIFLDKEEGEKYYVMMINCKESITYNSVSDV